MELDPRPHGHHGGAPNFRVVSGESSDDDIYSDEEKDGHRSLYGIDPNNTSAADELYDPNLDDEDETYVYKNLRGGIQETIQIRRRRNQQQRHQQRSDSTSQHDNGTLPVQSSRNTAPTERQAGSADPLAGSLQEEINYSRSLLHNKNDDQSHENLHDGGEGGEEVVSVQVYKPRNTDAVLSCPCCFTIVCMDCQRHYKYVNQFRAMFVMNIVVDWRTRLIYDNRRGGLREISGDGEDEYDRDENGSHQLLSHQPEASSMVQDGTSENRLHNEIPQDTTLDDKPAGCNDTKQASISDPDSESYFSVLCNNCGTQVAALDMRDEVYHFYGCLESS